MSYVVFDIETAVNPKAAEMITDMDTKIAKAGNVKDPTQKIMDKAALNWHLAVVLAIGVKEQGAPAWLAHGNDEAEVLGAFWREYSRLREEGKHHDFVGFNSNGFDMPMLYHRSKIRHLTMPALHNDRGYLMPWFIDLRLIWTFGAKMEPGGLGDVAEALGVGTKSGSGADFAELYERDQPLALKYLKHDLDLVEGVADRLL